MMKFNVTITISHYIYNFSLRINTNVYLVSYWQSSPTEHRTGATCDGQWGRERASQ
jgi:hypothetical protein